jgi:hypothetical protein
MHKITKHHVSRVSVATATVMAVTAAVSAVRMVNKQQGNLWIKVCKPDR